LARHITEDGSPTDRGARNKALALINSKEINAKLSIAPRLSTDYKSQEAFATVYARVANSAKRTQKKTLAPTGRPIPRILSGAIPQGKAEKREGGNNKERGKKGGKKDEGKVSRERKRREGKGKDTQRKGRGKTTPVLHLLSKCATIKQDRGTPRM
jgi:hypothetical protein